MSRSARDRHLFGTLDIDAGTLLAYGDHLRDHGVAGVSTTELIGRAVAHGLHAAVTEPGRPQPRRRLDPENLDVMIVAPEYGDASRDTHRALRWRQPARAAAMLTSVGPNGFTTLSSPQAADHHVPVLVQVGTIEQRPVARAGLVLVRPMLTLTVSCDHRYLSPAQAHRLAEGVRAYCADPTSFEDEVGVGVHGSAG